MRLAAYIRVSTGKQTISPEAQRTAIERYVELYGHEVILWASDVASGAKRNRPGLARALGSGADGIIVAKMDRLTRDIRHLLAIIDELPLISPKEGKKKEKMKLVSVKEKLDTDSANGQLFITIMGAMSQWEREVISQRTKDCLAENKRNGKRWTRVAPLGSKWEDGMVVADEGEQAMIQLAGELREGGLTLDRVAQHLNEAGYSTRRGGKFGKSSVCRMLQGATT